jgi:hypothetical protein
MEGGGGNLASLEQDAPAVPTRVVARLTVDPIALAAALDERLVATNCPSAPFPVKKAASSLNPPIGTVPGTGWRMDAPS